MSYFYDEFRTPLSYPVAARALLNLVAQDPGSPTGPRGLLHIGGPQRLSRWEMGQRLAAFLGCDPSGVVAVSRTSVTTTEPRPADISLDSSRWRSLFPQHEWPHWEEALAELLS